MDMKKLLTALTAITLLNSPTAFAQWDYGNISLVGNYNGDYFLKVTNVPDENNALPAYSGKLFKLSSGLGTDGFAVALAAVSSKKQVYMNSNVENQTGAYPVISVIYLTNKPITE